MKASPKPYVNSTRIGAADDIASGRSTFLVEMTEVSTIIHCATADSLVVLDEVERAMATYDGMAIAEAIVEHLHTVTQCRAVFATHYHGLVEMSSRRSLPLARKDCAKNLRRQRVRVDRSLVDTQRDEYVIFRRVP